ncbi:MAG: LysM peptidoglycan-binding domain-containing protein [Caldimicrobium sp.]
MAETKKKTQKISQKTTKNTYSKNTKKILNKSTSKITTNKGTKVKSNTNSLSTPKRSSSKKAEKTQSLAKANNQNKIKNQKQNQDTTTLREEPIHLTYTVKKGDTLQKISHRFGVPIEELKKLNQLKSNKLKPGQKIIVKTIYPSPATPSPKEDFVYHTVKEGETLYRISLNYNVPLEEIKRINQLEGNLISVGQKLKIPSTSHISEKPFVLESPKKTFEAKEENLKEKFEKNILAKNKILTPSMLSKDEEMAIRQKLVELSKNLADSRYKLGGSGNGYLDCSAFVKLVYEELGIKLPRSSPEQFQVGMPVEREALIPGDLVFFRTNGNRISHVGIYLGDSRFIHISSSKKRISIDSLEDPYFKRRYAGAKRVLNGEVLEYFQEYLKKNSNNAKTQENIETSSIPEVIF